MTERDAQITEFLIRVGWGDATRANLAGDASSRRYERIARGGERAVLMDAPPGEEAPACPEDASVERRIALGYNALARLAGPNLTAFVGLARELSSRGFSAPKVMAADYEQGFLLLEDLGDDLYARAIARGAEPAPLYAAAIDLLAAIRRSTFPAAVEPDGRRWAVQDYDAAAMQAEVDLFLDWYLPHRSKRDVSGVLRAEWNAAWAEAFTALETEPPVLVLRDVHAENLLWLPERHEEARVGLIDFQDALFGHPAYDLVSLLKDARRDVDPALARAMVERYMERACIEDAAAFARAYAVIGAQRNFKILGIFVRLCERDGKPAYLDFLPRVAAHVAADLEHPALAGVAAFVTAHAPDLMEDAKAWA